jgi:bifunctional non-homologous end joining protein LigD
MTDWFNRIIKPMLAVRGRPFSDEKFLYEIKWDGTRCIVFADVENKRLRMQNRRLMEISYRYPELDFFSFLDQNAVLDGEIVVLKDGKPSFPLLQKREHVDSKRKIEMLSKTIPAVYMAFDILYTASDGWIMDLPLKERKKILRSISNDTRRIGVTDFVKKNGEEFYRKAVEIGLEGVMAKKLESGYTPGKRSRAWIKIKKKQTADCIIVGWLEGEGMREGKFGSLILAMMKNGKLVHVGQVGTGFDFEFVSWFYEKLRSIEVDNPWFSENFSRKPHWVKPVYVCEVEFLELTEDLKLRAPVFVRLRNDKDIEECRIDDLLEKTG